MQNRLILAAALATLPAAAQSAFNCRRVDAVVDVRSEGTAERVGDLVLACTGGRPAATGAALPRFQFLVGVRGLFASRVFPAANSKTVTLTDSLLIVGEPGPGAQRACADAARNCRAAAGAEHNVFSGLPLGQSMLAFSDIPVAAPGDGKEVIVRVTNLRVHAAALRGGKDGVVTNVQIFDEAGRAVPVRDPEKQAARILDSVAVTVANNAGIEVAPAATPLTVTPAQLPKKDPALQQSFQVRFAELIPAAFRRRNVATTAADPALVAAQPQPSAAYTTESGFFNPQFPTAAYLSQLGLADSGTRLRVVFDGIPENVLVWVSVRDIDFPNADPRALLTYTNPAGGGSFSYSYPWTGDYAQLYVERGTASASWEIVTANPEALEKLSFSIALTAQGTAKLGAATMRAFLAPGEGASGNDPAAVPRFEDRSISRPAFKLSNSLDLPPVYHFSAASFEAGVVAPASLVSAFGAGFAATVSSSASPAETLDGVTVDFIDGIGLRHPGKLQMVSPSQVNYVVPDSLPAGPAVVNLRRAGVVLGTGAIDVRRVAPGLFTASGDGQGAPAGTFLRLGADSAEPEPLAVWNTETNRWTPAKMTLGNGEVYLSLYGTGIRGRTSLGAVQAKIAGVAVPVLYAAAHGSIVALDQINLGPLPKELAGKGIVALELTVDGQRANPVQLDLR